MVSGCDSDVRPAAHSPRSSPNVSPSHSYSAASIGSVASSSPSATNGFVANGTCIDNGFEADNVQMEVEEFEETSSNGVVNGTEKMDESDHSPSRGKWVVWIFRFMLNFWPSTSKHSLARSIFLLGILYCTVTSMKMTRAYFQTSLASLYIGLLKSSWVQSAVTLTCKKIRIVQIEVASIEILCYHLFEQSVLFVSSDSTGRQNFCQNRTVLEKILAFGRDLQTMSVQLRREHGKNETNKKTLQASQVCNFVFPILFLYIFKCPVQQHCF